ncbi:MAG: tetratricopeptide repeat protein [Verrucomicrobiota bacterium]|nr:tetratricopeptide repeat protein [Verrucomicrobiota bacterium]
MPCLISFQAQIISLVVCISCLNLSAAPKTNLVQLYHGIAEGNYLIGDLAGAERGLEQILRIKPDYLPALTLKARVMLEQSKPMEALAVTDRAIVLDPENNELGLLKAIALGHTDRRQEATALIQEILAKAVPESEDTRAAKQLLGLLRMAEGEWDDAATAFKEIYTADPDTSSISLRLSSEAYLEKARAKLQDGAQDEAIAAIDQAIAVYKDQTGKEALQKSTALRLLRARLLMQIGRFELAIANLQNLTAQQPQNFEALITLASLYASVERWESLETVIKPIAKSPELRDVVLYFEGRAALAKNRVGTARAKFEAAIQAQPKEADLLRRSLFFYRGLCLQKLGRHEEAVTSILDAIDDGFRPETIEEALVASRTLLRADRASDAIPILEAITLNQINPNAEAWAMLGRSHLASDTPTLALSAFNESLLIDSDQAELLALRGTILRKIGDLEGALTDYKKAYQLAPLSPVLNYEKGLVLLQLGRLPEAEGMLQIAARQLIAHSTLDLIHANCAYVIGKIEVAIESLSEYLAQNPKNPQPNAIYLAQLLQTDFNKNISRVDRTLDSAKNLKVTTLNDLVIQYFNGVANRKAVLDWAGIAKSPEEARRQICAAAFWMAQWEKANGDGAKAKELLKIALDTGNPDLTEWQLANWQWNKK